MSSIENDLKAQEMKKRKIPEEEFKADESSGTAVLTLRSTTTRTLDEALEKSGADLSQWKVDRWVANKWDMGAKIERDGGSPELAAMELWQVKVWFKAKHPIEVARSDLAHRLMGKAPILKGRRKPGKKAKLSLVIVLTDLHASMICFTPQSDAEWNLEIAKDYYLYALEEILQEAKARDKLEEIAFVIGSDMLHTDNIQGTTTKGTPQPECVDITQAILESEHLTISAIDRCRHIAPTRVIQVSGNHDYVTSFMLGRIVDAYYRNDKWVTVDATPAHYKFYEYGLNLVGVEHGHSIKRVEQFIGIMANHDNRGPWSRTKYHMWLLGDQHRKKNFEEQGVSFNYCQALCPANHWHKTHAYNNQQRGGVGFLLDKHAGKISTIESNIDRYTGEFFSRKG